MVRIIQTLFTHIKSKYNSQDVTLQQLVHLLKYPMMTEIELTVLTYYVLNCKVIESSLSYYACLIRIYYISLHIKSLYSTKEHFDEILTLQGSCDYYGETYDSMMKTYKIQKFYLSISDINSHFKVYTKSLGKY